MKRLLTAALFAATASAAQAEDVRLQLQWTTQAQFAGYYVAQEKGYYEEEGLNVTKIESRPIRGLPFQYRFHVDFELTPTQRAKLDEVLAQLGKHTIELKLLGIYRSAGTP